MASSKILQISAILSLLYICSAEFLTQSKEEILRLRNSIYPYRNKVSDIFFLLDNSMYVSGADFHAEKIFVTRLLYEITVGFSATRVQVIPYGSTASSYIDFVSQPARGRNNCAFDERFRALTYHGGSGGTALAFNEAWSVIFGPKSANKRGPVSSFKTVLILLSSGRWSGSDPRPRAHQLRASGVEILAFGVGSSSDLENLGTLTNHPATHVFHLASFDRFAELATYIRGDPYGTAWQVGNIPPSKCSNMCDPWAMCACSRYGTYRCACSGGYYGAGVRGQCKPCPADSYKGSVGVAWQCTPCPKNSSTNGRVGSSSVYYCKCKPGYYGRPWSGQECTAGESKASSAIIKVRVE